MSRRLVSLALLWTLALGTFAATPDPTVNSAAELLSAGRADDAIRLLDTHLKSQPQDAAAYNLLARTYFALQRWDDAIAAGEKAVALAPTTSSYHMWLGRMYGEKADHSNFVTAARLVKKVRSEFERAVELDGSNLDARTDLAEFYVEAPALFGGGKDKARREAEFMARQDAAVAHWVLARILEKENLADKAEAEYKAAIVASGYQARYWLNLASFYAGRHRYTEMEAAVSSAIHSEHKRPAAYFDAATLLVSAGRNFKGAAQFLSKYLLGGPTVEEAPAFQAHYVLGQIFEKEGNRSAAADEYRAALALAKDYRQAREALARVQR